MPQELVFKDIPGYSGVYVISQLGGVKCVESGHMLVQTQRPDGTLYVKLKGRNKGIARLVLEAHTGKCPANARVHYVDGNKSNVSLENIRWIITRRKDGKIARVARRADAVKPDVAERMKKLREATGMTYRELGKLYGIHPATACRICNR